MPQEGQHRGDPLEAAVRLAGATLAHEEGVPVVLDYGSVAGEMAACQQAVGITARLEAVVLELRGTPDAVSELHIALELPGPVAGVAVPIDGAWLCAPSLERVLFTGERHRGRAVLERVRTHAAAPGLKVLDVTSDHTVLGLIGPHAAAVLAAPEIGVPDVGSGHAFVEVLLAGSPAWLLTAGLESLVILTDHQHGVATWHALNEAGQPWGIASVGREALERLDVGVDALSRRWR